MHGWINHSVPDAPDNVSVSSFLRYARHHGCNRVSSAIAKAEQMDAKAVASRRVRCRPMHRRSYPNRPSDPAAIPIGMELMRICRSGSIIVVFCKNLPLAKSMAPCPLAGAGLGVVIGSPGLALRAPFILPPKYRMVPPARIVNYRASGWRGEAGGYRMPESNLV